MRTPPHFHATHVTAIGPQSPTPAPSVPTCLTRATLLTRATTASASYLLVSCLSSTLPLTLWVQPSVGPLSAATNFFTLLFHTVKCWKSHSHQHLTLFNSNSGGSCSAHHLTVPLSPHPPLSSPPPGPSLSSSHLQFTTYFCSLLLLADFPRTFHTFFTPHPPPRNTHTVHHHHLGRTRVRTDRHLLRSGVRRLGAAHCRHS